MLEQLKDVLKGLRWTESQISVYCTLLEMGTMKPADLSLRASVAQGKIYSVLRELSNVNGAVFESKASHKMYDAQNPRHVLEHILDDLRNRAEMALAEAEQVYEKRSEQIAGRLNCYTVQSISGVRICARDLANECKKSLKICDMDLNWIMPDIKSIQRRARSKEISVTIISTEAYSETLKDLTYSNVIGMVGKTENRFCIFDDKTVLLRFVSPDSATLVSEQTFVSEWREKFFMLEKKSDLVEPE